MGAVKRPKLHSGRVEIAVAGLINYRRNAIVPNVSWGLGLDHECDLLVLDATGRFTEIEIKTSAQDLRRDFEKWHKHRSNIISRLVYAVPEAILELTQELVPPGQGIIAVVWNGYQYKAEWVRRCKHDKKKGKPDAKTVSRFYELGLMRVWSLKQKLYDKMA